ncbi:MAG: signal peptidase I [Alphaproteobacteria bacterium]
MSKIILKYTRHLWIVFASCFSLPLISYVIFFKAFAISSVSMSPAFIEGEGLIVPRFNMLDVQRDIRRGDIVLYKSGDLSNIVFVTRVIGLPGDNVQVVAGRVFLNGEVITSDEKVPLKKDDLSQQMSSRGIEKYFEILPSGKSYPVLDALESQADNTQIFEVPTGSYFVLGDNRDFSNDSRFKGFVAEQNIIHKVVYRTYSFDGFKPRFSRFFKSVEEF